MVACCVSGSAAMSVLSLIVAAEAAVCGSVGAVSDAVDWGMETDCGVAGGVSARASGTLPGDTCDGFACETSVGRAGDSAGRCEGVGVTSARAISTGFDAFGASTGLAAVAFSGWALALLSGFTGFASGSVTGSAVSVGITSAGWAALLPASRSSKEEPSAAISAVAPPSISTFGPVGAIAVAAAKCTPSEAAIATEILRLRRDAINPAPALSR